VSGVLAEAIAVALLAVTVVTAVRRPAGLSEAVVAVPAAVLVVAVGILPGSAALDRLRAIGPTVGFLAAILVFGHLCADAGVFDYLGSLAARFGGRRPRRLLALVVTLAAAVTAVLTLDATVVLLTPVVLTTVRQMQVPARPHLYACTRLANSGSLLLPVSNLTNLLAFAACGLSFGRFAALMLVPWLIVCAAEWLGLRLFFRRDLPARSAPPPPARVADPRYAPKYAPKYALTVLAVTVAGFVLASSAGTTPAWAALGGCVLLLVPRARTLDLHPGRLIAEANPGFCLFVLALAIIVEGVTKHGLAGVLGHLVPAGTGLGALLAMAALSALLANAVNNLPATLALVPLVAGNPALVLAMLVGVNVGPNATYGGSLATLLWRRLLPEGERPQAGQFHRLGLITVPLLVVLATTAVWAAIAVVGV
jgi:arsenical pump membrane protein